MKNTKRGLCRLCNTHTLLNRCAFKGKRVYASDALGVYESYETTHDYFCTPCVDKMLTGEKTYTAPSDGTYEVRGK